MMQPLRQPVREALTLPASHRLLHCPSKVVGVVAQGLTDFGLCPAVFALAAFIACRHGAPMAGEVIARYIPLI
jgi:hypothetical protein